VLAIEGISTPSIGSSLIAPYGTKPGQREPVLRGSYPDRGRFKDATLGQALRDLRSGKLTANRLGLSCALREP
jgi:hypothetical protein